MQHSLPRHQDVELYIPKTLPECPLLFTAIHPSPQCIYPFRLTWCSLPFVVTIFFFCQCFHDGASLSFPLHALFKAIYPLKNISLPYVCYVFLHAYGWAYPQRQDGFFSHKNFGQK